jgi:hypothetical protein
MEAGIETQAALDEVVEDRPVLPKMSGSGSNSISVPLGSPGHLPDRSLVRTPRTKRAPANWPSR